MTDALLAHTDTILADAEQTLADAGRRWGRGPMRSIHHPANAWSVSQMAFCIGMSTEFVRKEIQANELKASTFGGEYRIHIAEVRRYLSEKDFPQPEWMIAE